MSELRVAMHVHISPPFLSLSTYQDVILTVSIYDWSPYDERHNQSVDRRDGEVIRIGRFLFVVSEKSGADQRLCFTVGYEEDHARTLSTTAVRMIQAEGVERLRQ